MITATILFGHFVADFLCQRREWANNKYRDSTALIKHVSVYTLLITAFLIIANFFTPYQIPLNFIIIWGILNGICHCVTDYFTSRMMHPLWATNPGLAFKILGFDQFIHLFVLFSSLGFFP